MGKHFSHRRGAEDDENGCVLGFDCLRPPRQARPLYLMTTSLLTSVAMVLSASNPRQHPLIIAASEASSVG